MIRIKSLINKLKNDKAELLERTLLEVEHNAKLEIIREVKTFNENYIENQALNIYLDDLQNHYIFKYKKEKK